MNIDVKNLSVHYEVAGEGFPLLALHGWGVDHRLMSGCLEPVFRNSPLPCRRYYPDLPGMGATPGTPSIAGSDDMLDYVAAFIEAAIGDGPFLLAGESYGGYLARGLVRRMGERIRGLLLICPSYKPWVTTATGIDKGDVPEHRVTEADAAFLAHLPEADRKAFEFLAVRKTRDAWNRFTRDVLPGIEAADQAFLSQCLSRNVPFREDPDRLASPFHGPTAIITARQDSSVGYRDIWTILESYPRATFAVLDGGGHNVQTERVPLFESLVADWLERVGVALAVPTAAPETSPVSLSTMEAIFTRRSVRDFEAREVEEEKKRLILQAAAAAPSAHGKQPWKFAVMSDQEVIRKVIEKFPWFAPAAKTHLNILVLGEPAKCANREYWVVDCAAATENALLAAQALGLGAVWMGIAPVEENIANFTSIVAVPDGLIPFSLIAVGYPKEGARPQKRKADAEQFMIEV